MTNIIIKNENRYLAKHDWLSSYHIFSFADYYDYNNTHFWNLRVFNDDLIKAKTWFWLHHHDNMEILTIVLKWWITHWDNLWNNSTTYAWEIQTMTAGSWIMHSEKNLWDEEVHLYQMWFYPNNRWLKPDYKNHKINLEDNKLNLLASWNIEDNVWFLNTDVKVYRWIFNKWEFFEYKIDNRWLFVYITTWSIKIWDNILISWDQLRFDEIWSYKMEVLEWNTDFILVDVIL